MLKILLHSIPGILFEPIAVGAVLGLITAAILLWKKRPVLYWVVAFSLLFMLGWRLAIQIISGRYAAILIFPATIATAYFIFKMDWLAGFIPKFPEWLRKWLPYLTVIGIAIGGVGQLCHYNAYADRILKVAELIKSDAKQYKSSCILTTEDRRLRYYTGLPANSISMTNVSPNSLQKEIAAVLKKGPDQPAEICYIVLPMSSKLPEDHYFQQVPDFIRQELVLLGEFFHNSKKRRLSRVYKYDIRKAFEMREMKVGSQVDECTPVYKFLFKECYPEKHNFYADLVRRHCVAGKKSQMPTTKQFPLYWTTYALDGFGERSNGEMGLIADRQGNITFRLKSDSLIAAISTKFLKVKPYNVRITLRGTPGSIFTVGFHCYKKSWVALMEFPLRELIDDQLWKFGYTYRILPQDIDKIRLTVRLYRGEIFVHSIELYEVEDDK